MTSSILQIVGSVLGMLAAWYIGTQVVRWVGRYKRKQDTNRIIDERQDMADDTKRQDDEKKRLDQIENDFSGKP